MTDCPVFSIRKEVCDVLSVCVCRALSSRHSKYFALLEQNHNVRPRGTYVRFSLQTLFAFCTSPFEFRRKDVRWASQRATYTYIQYNFYCPKQVGLKKNRQPKTCDRTDAFSFQIFTLLLSYCHCRFLWNLHFFLLLNL